jgi:hypothetical protein
MGAGRGRSPLQIDPLHLVDQTAVGRLQAGEFCLLSTGLEPAGKTLQQPRPQRVDLFDVREVDRNATGGLGSRPASSTSCSRRSEYAAVHDPAAASSMRSGVFVLVTSGVRAIILFGSGLSTN